MLETRSVGETRMLAWNLASESEVSEAMMTPARWWTYTPPGNGFDGWDQEP